MLKTHCVFVLLATLAAGSMAQGATIPFSGTGTSGSISPDSLPWALTPNDSTLGDPFLRSLPVWGDPGLAAGDATWPPGSGDALAFTITFTGLPTGVTIDQTADATPTGFDDFTRFHNLGDVIIWTPSYSGGNSVTFTAPSNLQAGTEYYVNVAFTGGAVDTVNFTGDWTTTSSGAAAPEPGFLWLVGLVLVGVALFARRRVLN